MAELGCSCPFPLSSRNMTSRAEWWIMVIPSIQGARWRRATMHGEQWYSCRSLLGKEKKSERAHSYAWLYQGNFQKTYEDRSLRGAEKCWGVKKMFHFVIVVWLNDCILLSKLIKLYTQHWWFYHIYLHQADTHRKWQQVEFAIF